MHKISKLFIIIFLAATLAFIPFGSSALAKDRTQLKEISAEAMLGDFFFVRPVGVLASAVGTCVYIFSLPFTAMGGNVKEARQKLVTDPFEFTFKRPLGDL